MNLKVGIPYPQHCKKRKINMYSRKKFQPTSSIKVFEGLEIKSITT